MYGGAREGETANKRERKEEKERECQWLEVRYYDKLLIVKEQMTVKKVKTGAIKLSELYTEGSCGLVDLTVVWGCHNNHFFKKTFYIFIGV